MVLLHKKQEVMRKIHVKGHSGGSLWDVVGPHIVPTLISGVRTFNRHAPYHTTVQNAAVPIATALGGIAATGLLYGGKKIYDKFKKQDYINGSPGPIHNPQLTVGALPQGTLGGDMLPATANITVVDPKNHQIELADGMVKNQNNVVTYRRNRVAGAGIKHAPRKKGGMIKNMLDSKSKDILLGLRKGSGIYNF